MTTQSKTAKKTKTTTPSKENAMSPTKPNATKTTKTSTENATIAGPSVGLAPLVARLSNALDTAEAGLGAEAPATTASQKRHTGKARKGSDKAVALIAPIVQQHGLDSSSLSTTEMMAHQAKAQTLVALRARLQKATKRVGDETFDAQSTAWDMALQFYALLRRRAKTDGAVAEAIAPVAHLFSYRHPSTKEGKLTKVQTRIRSKLKDATALAERHGVVIEAPEVPVPSATPAQPAELPSAPVASTTTVVPAGITTAAPAVAPVVPPVASTSPAAIAAPAPATNAPAPATPGAATNGAGH